MSARAETDVPAPEHFMSELGFDVEGEGETWTGAALVPEGACLPQTGFPLTSVLLMYCDVIAGGQVRALTLPRLSMTVDLSLDIVDPEAPAQSRSELTARSRLLRGGKRLFFTETVLEGPRGEPVAVCTGAFSAISRTLNAFGDRNFRRGSRYDRPLLSAPLSERVGLVTERPGAAEVARRPDLGNSTDTLMGGLHGLLGETAALSAVEAEDARPCFAARLQVRYLAPVRVGPARAEVRLLGGTPARRLVRLDLLDRSSGELAADITVSCVPIG